MPYGRRGGEFVVNKQLVGNQYAPSVAGFASGGFIVVWDTSDTLQDGAGRAIKAQRYDSLGNAVGPEILVNTSAAGEQRTPSVTTLASGGYVVTWETTDTAQDGSGLAIKGQLFDAAGAALGPEFRVNSQSAADQINSSVSGLDGGGFVVTWRTGDQAQDGSGGAIKGQIYSAAGVAVGGEFLVNTGAVGSENHPNVTGLAGGGFVATWTLGGGQQGDIYAQVFSSSGAKSGGQFIVNSTTALGQSYAAVSQISGGRFVVTWGSSVSTSSFDTEIRARIFSADGTPLGSDFLVSTSRLDPGSGLRVDSYQPSVEDLPNGGFVITWTHSAGLAARSSIRGQFFDASGNRAGSEVVVSTVTDRFEERGDVAVDGNGMVFAVWGSYNQTASDADIRGQLFGPGGAPEIVSNGGGDVAAVTVAENQNAVTTASAVDPDGSGALVYAIVAGVDASRFAINPSTGALTFVSSPNFEQRVDWDNNGTYEVVISVSDGVMTDTQALTVTVSNVNEAPILSGSQSAYFHIENRTAVATFAATDPDGNSVTWSIAGGADAARFAIDPNSGALRFVTAPDFEAPGDVGANNFYNVTIAAGDGSLFATRALTIEIANWNEGPVIVSGGGGASASVGVAENTGFVTTVVADDPDASDSSYSFAIAGGADAALFIIHAQTGQLFFKSNLGANFEAPADVGGNNVYDVIVSVSDGFEPADTQAISVTVTDANDAPFITSNGGGASAFLSISENQLAVTTVTGTDADNGALAYGIAGGADAALFAIDAQTGLLSFLSAPDREAPGDAGADNVYNVTVSVSDGAKSATQALSVTVLDVNDAPTVTSNGGGNAATVSVAENGLAVTDVAAVDPERQALSYAISGGADSSRFAIDSATGALSFLTTPDHEQPADSDGNNVYEVIVSASDGVFSDSQTLSITVGDVNERPIIVSDGGGTSASVSLDEGQTAVTNIVAADPDEAGAVTYSITGGAHADLFAIDAATGALSFAAAPDFESPLGESSNFYSVIVTASDGELSSFQSVQVSIRDIEESPTITTGPALSVDEDSAFVTKVTATDGDGDPLGYAIVGGADASHFVIDAVTGDLSIRASLDFEAPADADGDNVYEVTVRASDGQLSDERQLSIAVNDVDDDVEIVSYGGADSVSLTLQEGGGFQVADVDASLSSFQGVTFAIGGGADADLFRVDPYSGLLAFAYGVYPDFEAPADADGDNVYDVVVVASNATSSDDQAFAIAVANRNEGLWITSNDGGDATVSMNEGDRIVTTVAAFDQDGDVPTYSIVGGADSALFAIDPVTGVLTFIAAPDYEAPHNGVNFYSVEVGASDGEFTDLQRLRVEIGNVNEGVTITSGGGGETAAVTVAENGLAVTGIAAADVDGDAVTYSIAGGADSARFTIDAQTGALRFVQAPDFEAPADADGNNIYDVVVSATDGAFTDSQAVAVTVANLDEAIVITSNGGGAAASVAVAENGTAVAAVTASDPDGGSITYAIAGGADSARFTIDATTGVLAFIAAPDFEAPGDSGGNNVYDVVVSASDGSFTDSQAIAVTVGNSNEAPVITSNGGGAGASVAVVENVRNVTTVAAADPDGTPVTYSIVGGADSARFTIDAQTGALQFVVAPDWELPGDSNQDNVYALVVRSSDGQLFDDQALSVTVTNTRDGNNVTGTSGGDSISAISTNVALRTSNEEDLVFGRDGHDTIQGMAGDDELYGEGGNDVLVGGDGADKLLGGLGKDQFSYNAVSESTIALRDLIMDFSRAQGDKISLSAIDSNSLLSGNQAFTFIGASAFSNVAGQLRYETAGGMTTISGDVNGDGVADLQIQLSGSVALVASDFIL